MDPKATDPSKEGDEKTLGAASTTPGETIQGDSESHDTTLGSRSEDEIPTKTAAGLDSFESEDILPQNRRLMEALISNADKTKEPAADLDAIKAYGSAIQQLCPILETYRSRLPLAPRESKLVHAKMISNHLAYMLTIDPAITGTALDSSYHSILGFFEGPPSSPYAGGIFSVLMTLPPDYPFHPPRCRFLTKMYHPNIDWEGQICLDILEKSQWSPGIGLGMLLISILSILTDPGLDDPLVPEIAVTYLVDRKQFDEDAELYTRKYATLENAISLLPQSSSPDSLVAKPSDEDVEDLAGKLSNATLEA